MRGMWYKDWILWYAEKIYKHIRKKNPSSDQWMELEDVWEDVGFEWKYIPRLKLWF